MTNFNDFSESYEATLAESVRFAGEPQFFYRSKAYHLRRLLGSAFAGAILDYGCGVGALLRELRKVLPQAQLYGYDPSTESSRRAAALPGVTSAVDHVERLPRQQFDVALLTNVLHHVEPSDRLATMAAVLRLLMPRGRVAVFEHNPFNPLTRHVVRVCPFDLGVTLLTPRGVRRLLAGSGFVDVRQGYTTFFPQAAERLLALEPWLRRLPIGAQTLTIARVPSPDEQTPELRQPRH